MAGLMAFDQGYKNFALVSIKEEPFKVEQAAEVEKRTLYRFGIHVTSQVVHKSNLEMLNTMEYPNYYPLSRDMELKGWTIGQNIFEKQWMEAVKGFEHYDWTTENLQNIATLAKKVTGSGVKPFVINGMSSEVKNILVDAYFSHMWNSIVAQRLNMMGSQPQIGDLAYSSNSSELVILKDEHSRSSTNPTGIVMPVPGSPPSESYASNASLLSIYLSFFPKLTSPWFVGRIREFSLTTKYRPMLCNPQHFVVNWTSEREFSLSLTLPNTNSVQNILKGLETCLQLAGNQAAPIVQPSQPRMGNSLARSEPFDSSNRLQKKNKTQATAESCKPSLPMINFRSPNEQPLLDTVESGSNEDEQMASSSSAHLNSSDINVIDLDFENDSDFLPDTSARKSKKPKFEATSCFTTRSASISTFENVSTQIKTPTRSTGKSSGSGNRVAGSKVPPKPYSRKTRSSSNRIIDGEPSIGHVKIELNANELPCTNPGSVDMEVQQFPNDTQSIVGIETDEPGLLGTCSSSSLVDSQNLTSSVPNAAHSSPTSIVKSESGLLENQIHSTLLENVEIPAVVKLEIG